LPQRQVPRRTPPPGTQPQQPGRPAPGAWGARQGRASLPRGPGHAHGPDAPLRRRRLGRRRPQPRRPPPPYTAPLPVPPRPPPPPAPCSAPAGGARAARRRAGERRPGEGRAGADPAVAGLFAGLRGKRDRLAYLLWHPGKDADAHRREVEKLTDEKEDLERRLA